MNELNEEQIDRLNDLYYNKKYTRGIHAFYHKVNEGENDIIPRRKVEEWLKSQVNYQLNVMPMKTKHVKPILSNRPFSHLQIDLIDFTNKPSMNFRYILMCVDVFSKYLIAKAIPNKQVNTVRRYTEIILNEIEELIQPDKKIKIVMTDQGPEFGTAFNEMLTDRGVKHIYSFPKMPQTQGVVESTNKTIKYQLLRQRGQWHLNLPKVVELYNETIHSTTKKRPTDVVYFNEVQRQTLTKLVREKKIKEAHKKITAKQKFLFDELKPGDKVRLKIHKGKMDSMAKQNWTEEIFTIKKINKSKKPYLRDTFTFADNEGVTYAKVYREDL